MNSFSNKRIQIGHSSVSVGPLCFGTSGLGNMPDTYGYSVDEERGLETVRAIFASPAGFLDSARLYGQGRSEERIGKVIRELGGVPDGFVLATKIDRNLETGAFDASQARRSLEQSLTALGVDRVPILQLHDPEHAASYDETVGPNGALAELFKMKEEGLTDAVGIAAGPTDMMIPLVREWDFDVLITHNRFMLTNRNAEPLMNLAVERGISVLNAAPYAGGVLAKGGSKYPRYVYQEADGETLHSIRQFESISTRYEVPLGAIALQFSMRDPRVASTVCGVSKASRIEQTHTWAEWDIPEEVWEEVAKVPFSTDDPEATRDYKPG
ncbi:aldo/keto reductase [Verrucomicrobiales bacterium]|nr:aldo/keto reductase [Verrucomicrobiales bacterium]